MQALFDTGRRFEAPSRAMQPTQGSPRAAHSVAPSPEQPLPIDELTELRVALARLEGKLDMYGLQTTAFGGDLKDHEKRLRALEEARTKFLTYATVVGAAASLAVGLVGKLFLHL